MKLKTLKIRELRRILRKHGLVIAATGKGSHRAVLDKSGKRVATITAHGNATEMSKSVLRQFFRNVGIDPEAVLG